MLRKMVRFWNFKRYSKAYWIRIWPLVWVHETKEAVQITKKQSFLCEEITLSLSQEPIWSRQSIKLISKCSFNNSDWVWTGCWVIVWVLLGKQSEKNAPPSPFQYPGAIYRIFPSFDTKTIKIITKRRLGNFFCRTEIFRRLQLCSKNRNKAFTSSSGVHILTSFVFRKFLWEGRSRCTS